MKKESQQTEYSPFYGNLVNLNSSGVILNSVGQSVLKNIADSYISVLGSSSAIYEINGDYALGIFSSGWCQALDAASRVLCGKCSNREALEKGKWLCHESCWTDCAKVSVEKKEPVDIECHGGIHLYGVPIFANGVVVGAINFGYGNPPRDKKKLEEISGKYKIDIKELEKLSGEYEPRSEDVIEISKKYLKVVASLIGAIVEKAETEKALKKHMGDLEVFHKVSIGRESKMVELKKEINRLLDELGKPRKYV